MPPLRRLVPATLLLPVSSALAHDGRPLAPHDLWTAWTLEPVVVLVLALTAWLYLRGTRALWARAGTGAGIRVWEVVAFAFGWTALAIALVSPLHAMGSVLFSAHMVQHEVLMAVAAPLIVVARPIVPALWALPPRWRRRLGAIARRRAVRLPWTTLTRPLAATALHGIAIWLWHAPALYTTTLRSELAHSAQHASFLVTALLFWWALLALRARRLHPGAGVLYLFVTMVHTGMLGALLVFASEPFYPAYGATTVPWGLTALEDQQLAGLIMWAPAALSYGAAALWLMAGVVTNAGARTRRPLIARAGAAWSSADATPPAV